MNQGNHNHVHEQTNQEDFSLDALRAGDRAEFSRVVDAYSGKLYRLALRMLNQPQDAEDVLQDTFLKAFRHLDRFDGRSSLSTWLYRILTNEALMVLRRKHPDMVSIDEPKETADAKGKKGKKAVGKTASKKTEKAASKSKSAEAAG